METRNAIDKFFASPPYAVVGVSRHKHKFGNTIFHEMKRRGLAVYPVHPHLAEIEGMTCFASIADVPDEVQSVVVVVHPEDVRQIITACARKGIENIWLQQGAESDEAVEFARHNKLNVVHGQCVLMFLDPVKSFHAAHRWVNKLIGAYPH